jgi:hypothetical protein
VAIAINLGACWCAGIAASIWEAAVSLTLRVGGVIYLVCGLFVIWPIYLPLEVPLYPFLRFVIGLILAVLPAITMWAIAEILDEVREIKQAVDNLHRMSRRDRGEIAL